MVSEEPEQPEAVQPATSGDVVSSPDDSEKTDAGEFRASDGDKLATVEPVAVDPKAGLTGKDLAERLGRNAGSITKHFKAGDLPDWSKELDPDGISWGRKEKEKLYFPIP